VELRLKEVIMTIRYCNSKGCDFPQTHHLDHLWTQLKNDYRELGESATDHDFKNADRIIKEFSKIDPNSVVFPIRSIKRVRIH